jgi:hypothetical protein
MITKGKRIVGAATGRYNTIVLDDQGTLYVWGFDGCAVGAVPKQGKAWVARPITGELQAQRVVAFDAGEFVCQESECWMHVHSYVTYDSSGTRQ